MPDSTACATVTPRRPDGGADLATRSIDRGPLPLFCRKRQPALGSNNRSIPLGFDRIVLEVVKRRADQPGLRCRLCLAQDGIAPTQVGVHLRLSNSSLLQEIEWLAGIDRA